MLTFPHRMHPCERPSNDLIWKDPNGNDLGPCWCEKNKKLRKSGLERGGEEVKVTTRGGTARLLTAHNSYWHTQADISRYTTHRHTHAHKHRHTHTMTLWHASSHFLSLWLSSMHTLLTRAKNGCHCLIVCGVGLRKCYFGNCNVASRRSEAGATEYKNMSFCSDSGGGIEWNDNLVMVIVCGLRLLVLSHFFSWLCGCCCWLMIGLVDAVGCDCFAGGGGCFRWCACSWGWLPWLLWT